MVDQALRAVLLVCFSPWSSPSCRKWSASLHFTGGEMRFSKLHTWGPEYLPYGQASNHLRPAPSIQPLDFCGKQRHVSLLKWEKASRSIFQLGGIHFKLLASQDTEKYNNIAWTQILGPSQTRFNVSGGVTHPWKWTTHQESLANSGKDCRRIGFSLFNLPPPVYIFISCPASLICHGPQNSLQ